MCIPTSTAQVTTYANWFLLTAQIFAAPVWKHHFFPCLYAERSYPTLDSQLAHWGLDAHITSINTQALQSPSPLSV